MGKQITAKQNYNYYDYNKGLINGIIVMSVYNERN